MLAGRDPIRFLSLATARVFVRPYRRDVRAPRLDVVSG